MHFTIGLKWVLTKQLNTYHFLLRQRLPGSAYAVPYKSEFSAAELAAKRWPLADISPTSIVVVLVKFVIGNLVSKLKSLKK